MRYLTIIIQLAIAAPLCAQEVKITPTEELRITVTEWIGTMRRIQAEENDWMRDQEVLANYKEGLEKEIIDLKEKIADAKTRKAGSESETMKQSEERDLYKVAKDQLSVQVRKLEEDMISKIVLVPAPLRAEPKVSQAIEDIQRDINLPVEKRAEGVSKRLLNLINLNSEIEKFQQTVVLRQELHKDSAGNEFNMKVVYFGLSSAYAVNDEKTLALVGRPDPKTGWVFQERKDLASAIANLIAITTGDEDAAFVYLPFSKP
jgi:hypothetical protein